MLQDKSKDIRILYSILIGNRPHVLTVVIIGHLLAEHLLDQIIIARLKNRKVLRATFSQKLEALYPTWLPLNTYKNLKILNALRNDLAHNLGIGKYKPIYFGPRREKVIVKVPKRATSGNYYPRKLVEFILYEMTNNNIHTLNIPLSTNLRRLFRKRGLKKL